MKIPEIGDFYKNGKPKIVIRKTQKKCIYLLPSEQETLTIIWTILCQNYAKTDDKKMNLSDIYKAVNTIEIKIGKSKSSNERIKAMIFMVDGRKVNGERRWEVIQPRPNNRERFVRLTYRFEE